MLQYTDNEGSDMKGSTIIIFIIEKILLIIFMIEKKVQGALNSIVN